MPAVPSARGCPAYRPALAALLLLLAAPAAARERAPRGDVVLDAANPVIAAEIGGVPVRLRVDPAQWDSVELNPDAAGRLAVTWSAGRHFQVGRVILWGRTATARLAIAGTRRPVLVATHDRVAAGGADGVIGPDLLPYARVRWMRAGAPDETGAIVLPLTLDDRIGLVAPAAALAPGLALRFSLGAEGSSGTAAAGALLAGRFGGRFDGPVEPVPVILGVARPARAIAFARPFRVAGFRLPRLLVRIADFRGDNPLPAEAVAEADIVVAHRERPQEAQAWILLGRDRLARCAEITYEAKPRSLSLRCAFDP